MTYRSVIAFLTIIAVNGCIGDIHSWGQLHEYSHYKMYSRTLINESSVIPRDYIIFYKYYGAPYKPVARFKIDVNTRSEGYVHMRHISQETYFKRTERAQMFDARVTIRNATNVTATVHIHGEGVMSMPSMGLRKLESTKSLTYVHAKNSDASLRQPMAVQNSIGKRRDGDELIYFKSKRVRNANRFPSTSFEYSGDEYITCVRFSFDSATAMVMINTTFVEETVFNGIVYDMNSDYFVANMSIYGLKNRPNGFEGVI